MHLEVIERRASSDGAVKYLLRYPDGSRTESVFFRMDDDRDKDSVCVSSQVGCTLSCSFCVTGKLGLMRNLSGSEVAGQVTSIFSVEGFRPHRRHEVAYMGMGEPMFNLDAVLESRRLLVEQYPEMDFIVSTAGVVPGIERLCQEGRDFRLQISLHASTDDLRTRMMAINKRYPIAMVLDAAEGFAESSGRSVIINYVLMSGINDSGECARQLGGLLRRRPFSVQLVIANPDPRIPYQPVPAEALARFAEILRGFGLQPLHSVQLGVENGGGCGQLDAEYEARRARLHV
jgi:23S rRNA (adenine2503-C2)-methyltransferase